MRSGESGIVWGSDEVSAGPVLKNVRGGMGLLNVNVISAFQ